MSNRVSFRLAVQSYMGICLGSSRIQPVREYRSIAAQNNALDPAAGEKQMPKLGRFCKWCKIKRLPAPIPLDGETTDCYAEGTRDGIWQHMPQRRIRDGL